MIATISKTSLLIVFFVLYCFLPSSDVYGQKVPPSDKKSGISGTWDGVLTQVGNGSFVFQMEIVQNGTRITGTSRIQKFGNADKGGSEYYAVLEIKGTFVNNVLEFQETSFRKNVPQPGYRWCQKQGRLNYVESETLSRLDGEWTEQQCSPGSITLTRQNGLICDDPDLRDSFDASEAEYHSYQIFNLICSPSDNKKCTRQNVYNTMLKANKYIAPTKKSYDNVSVKDCAEFDVIVPGKMSNIVKAVTSPEIFSVSNYTTKDHYLYPGKIQRTVYADKNGNIYVFTLGRGIGNARWANEFFSGWLWGRADDRLKEKIKKDGNPVNFYTDKVNEILKNPLKKKN